MGVCYLACFVLTERSCQHGASIEPLNRQPGDDLIHTLHHLEGDRFHFSHLEWQMWTIPLTIINLCLKGTGRAGGGGIAQALRASAAALRICLAPARLAVIIPLLWIMGQEGSEWCFDRDEISTIGSIAWAGPLNLIILCSQITRPSHPTPPKLTPATLDWEIYSVVSWKCYLCEEHARGTQGETKGADGRVLNVSVGWDPIASTKGEKYFYSSKALKMSTLWLVAWSETIHLLNRKGWI